MTIISTTQKRLICPSCGTQAKRVSPLTLRALLKDEFASEFGDGNHSSCGSNGNGDTGCTPISDDTGWRFCDSPNCDVVYFSETDDRAFVKSQLHVSVGVKEKTGDRPLCYCFGHSVASIKEELRMKRRSEALEDIRAKMKKPGCRCETENPSGSCCLGNVTKGIAIAREELGMSDETVPTRQTSPESSTNRGELIAKVGTIISAIMASACCWLPLVLLAVGVSGAGIAATLEAYRPLFITLTFGFLAAAFHFTCRPRSSQTSNGDCCSTAKDGCAVPNGETKWRFSRMTLNKAILWSVTLLAVLFQFFPKYAEFVLANREAANETTAANLLVRKTTIAIDGMSCEGCAAALQKTIKAVPGVLSVKVDYNIEQAMVSTAACCPFPNDEIFKAIEEAGFIGAVR